MKTTFKRIAALLSAAAIAMTLSGCADNGYIMTVDGMQIRNGVYISFQQTSMNNVNDRISELNSSDSNTSDGTESTDSSDSSSSSDSTSSDVDIFTLSVDGKSVSDWVKEDTVKGLKRFVGIQRQCEKYGITLTDEERSEINKEVQENWDMTSVNYYGYTFTIEQMYGYKTMGKYYESQGIGIESLKEIAAANKLSDKLFMYYYGEGGEKAVPDDEINKYMEDNYSTYKLITLNYTNYRGEASVEDEDKKETVDTAKSYADRYNKGEKFSDIVYDFNLRNAQKEARGEAEDYYTETPQEGYTLEEYLEYAAGKATVEKSTLEDDDYNEVIENENSPLTDTVTDFIKEAPKDGKAAVYEGTSAAYVIIRSTMDTVPEWRKNHLEEILTAIKGKEYDSTMDLMSQNYDIVQNDYLVNTKYAPEKLNK